MHRSHRHRSDRPSNGIPSRLLHGSLWLLAVPLAVFLMASCASHAKSVRLTEEANAHEKTGQALMEGKSYSAAAREFKQAAESGISSIETCLAASDCRMDESGKSNFRSFAAANFAKQAFCLMNAGDLAGARAALGRAFTQNPRSSYAHFVQGLVQVKSGDISSARKEADILRKPAPEMARILDEEIGRAASGLPGEALPGGPTPSLRDLLFK